MSGDTAAVKEVSPSYAPDKAKSSMLEGYKQTGAGIIPEGWKASSILNLCDQIMDFRGRTPRKLGMEWGGGDIPALSAGNVRNGHIDFSAECYYGSDDLYQKWMSKGCTKKDDILFTTEAPLGNVALVPDDQKYILSQRTVLFKTKPDVAESKFVYQYLLSETFQRVLSDYSSGSTAKGIQRKKLERLDIPLPPPKEQRAIATALSDVDALLEELDRLIAKKRDLKQATMQQLLTGQTRLPGFEGEWEDRRLRDIAQLNRLGVVPAARPDQNFIHFSLPAFDDGKLPRFEQGRTIGSNKFVIPPEAVLVSKLNPRIPRIWAPESIPENSCGSTEWLVLTPNEKTSRLFLFTICLSPDFCRKMELTATGTTGSHQRISPNSALDISVRLPKDIQEQNAIAEAIQDIEAEIQSLKQRRHKSSLLKQAMMQELLTGKTRLIRNENTDQEAIS